MEFLLDYGLFLAKVVTFIVAVVVLLILAKSVSGKSSAIKGELEITDLSELHKSNVEHLEHYLHDEAYLKARHKAEKKEEKEKDKLREKEIKKAAKEGKLDHKREPHLFVLDFNGSIDAKEVKSLREEITAILAVAGEGDEVLLRLESGGGMVHGYGLASSQLDRIKAAGLPLTIAVDKVAASGGYMMACIGNRILSAPFAALGSIGVVAQLPNIHRLLKKNNIDVEILTAGDYKRTLTVLGENTEPARQKFLEELQTTHDLFKGFVGRFRPQLNMDEVATGEVWLGTEALRLDLVDDLQTSDAYLSERAKQADVYLLEFIQKKTMQERVGLTAGAAAERVADKAWERLQQRFMS